MIPDNARSAPGRERLMEHYRTRGNRLVEEKGQRTVCKGGRMWVEINGEGISMEYIGR